MNLVRDRRLVVGRLELAKPANVGSGRPCDAIDPALRRFVGNGQLDQCNRALVILMYSLKERLGKGVVERHKELFDTNGVTVEDEQSVMFHA